MKGRTPSGFASILLLLIGGLTLFEGLTAINPTSNYVVTGRQLLNRDDGL